MSKPHPQTRYSTERYEPRIRMSHGTYKLWGSRGSIPVSGPQYVRHGGNTSCLEFTHGENRIIFDAGSGLRQVGLSMTQEPAHKIHLFITHTHWDHIQGFPFFAPAYMAGYEIAVYAAPSVDRDLESIFRGQLDRAYFPVQMEDMQARLEFNYIEDQPIRIGDIEISWEHTFHPGFTVGYKMTVDGRQLVFIPDNEFLKGYMGKPLRSIDSTDAETYGQLIEFCRGADVLIHEAQYTHDEYPIKVGWGHTSVPNACTLAKVSEVEKWIVTHHDPSHEDDFLQSKLNLTRQILHEIECSAEVQHGYDGMVGYL